MSKIDLNSLREKIDDIDAQLLTLFNQRASLAIDVAEAKRAALKPGETLSFFRPDREAQVIQRIQSLNQGPLSNQGSVA